MAFTSVFPFCLPTNCDKFIQSTPILRAVTTTSHTSSGAKSKAHKEGELKPQILIETLKSKSIEEEII